MDSCLTDVIDVKPSMRNIASTSSGVVVATASGPQMRRRISVTDGAAREKCLRVDDVLTSLSSLLMAGA